MARNKMPSSAFTVQRHGLDAVIPHPATRRRRPSNTWRAKLHVSHMLQRVPRVA